MKSEPRLYFFSTRFFGRTAIHFRSKPLSKLLPDASVKADQTNVRDHHIGFRNPAT
jgi:hypothetical protein